MHVAVADTKPPETVHVCPLMLPSVPMPPWELLQPAQDE